MYDTFITLAANPHGTPRRRRTSEVASGRFVTSSKEYFSRLFYSNAFHRFGSMGSKVPLRLRYI